ncbi:MAG: NCS2 family permease [Okeania sp. SIO3I5]|uniref:NCS2 family permease n=1 Tax=Okeania sp. SIO3I5 TaxID=2607805 RepID=UPI0013B86717|nr:NCS2 family permease [Okeania sp. SIO3I5]NEQ39399.1 NCS2 family permease [Okeania sp. SIO3I5]
MSPENRQSNKLGIITNFFQFNQLQTNFYREIIAGITTFVTMAYILVVNPDILSKAIFLQNSGDLFGELVIATAISAAFATLIMGIYANYPYALAPGMGLNAYFTFSVVLKLGISWQVALAAVFIEGLIFIGLTISKIRIQIVNNIPECIKQATTAGIGLFIAYIGLTSSQIIVTNEATTTTLGNLNQPETLVAIAGIIITSAFVVRRITGALLWGILATALLAWMLGIAPFPKGIISFPQLPIHLFGQAFIGLENIVKTNIWELITIIFVLIFVDLFDTVGTLTGLGIKVRYFNQTRGALNLNKAFMADAIGTTFGAVMGTSTVTSYIESAAGISEGGRSGFTAVVVGFLFILSIFFIPLLSAIPSVATAPTLLIVGVLMMGSVRNISWDDPAESISAFLTIIIMPLSYSIADGLAMGLISYPLLKTFQGKFHETTFFMWILTVIFVLKFLFVGK